MRILAGDFNIYWTHDTLTPHTVRAARYGSSNDSGGLVPEVGDVIRDFPGSMGKPITVRVVEVTQSGQGVVAFDVKVATVPAPLATHRYTKTAIREAHWIAANLEPGAFWAVGHMGANREAELVRMGVFIPTDDPALYTIARADIPPLPPRGVR